MKSATKKAPLEFELSSDACSQVDRLLDACDVVEELESLPFRVFSIDTPVRELPNDSLVILKLRGKQPQACRWFRKPGNVAEVRNLSGRAHSKVAFKNIEWARQVVEASFTVPPKQGKAS